MMLSNVESLRHYSQNRLEKVDVSAQSILKEFQAVSHCKKATRRIKKAEYLIYRVVHVLRRKYDDHLLQTTSIWVLISLLRLEVGDALQEIRRLMTEAGIPGIVYDILKAERLSGSTKQYASELCFFLCSDQQYPLKSQLPSVGPFTDFPDIAKSAKNIDFDAISLASSDLSSSVESKRGRGIGNFVPYRISADNMRKMNKMFNVGQSMNDEDVIGNNIINAIGSPGYIEDSVYSQLNDSTNDESVDYDLDSLSCTDSMETNDMTVDSKISSLPYKIHLQYGSNTQTILEDDELKNYNDPRNANTAKGVWSSSMSVGNDSVVTTDSSQIHRLQHYSNMQNMYSKELHKSFSDIQQRERSKLLRDDHGTQVFQIGGTTKGMPNSMGTHTLSNPNAVAFSATASPSVYHDTYYNPNYNVIQEMQETRNLLRSRSSLVNNSTTNSLNVNPIPGSPMNPSSSLSNFQNTNINNPKLLSRSVTGAINTADSWRPLSRSTPGNAAAIASGTANIMGPRSVASGQSTLFGTSRKIRSGFQPLMEPSMTSTITSNEGNNPFNTGLADQDPSDVPGLYASLDPLSLNVSVGFFEAVKTRKRPRNHSNGNGNHKNSHVKMNISGNGNGNGNVDLEESGAEMSMESDDNEDDDYDEEDEDEDEDDLNDEEDDDLNSVHDLNDVSQDIDNDLDNNNSNNKRIRKENEYIRRQKMRIKSDKLIDYSFIKKLFLNPTLDKSHPNYNPKMSHRSNVVLEGQSLLRRMEDLLTLMDHQKTGFVTWESFCRVILAIAPQHMLRADIIGFLDSQLGKFNTRLDKQLRKTMDSTMEYGNVDGTSNGGGGSSSMVNGSTAPRHYTMDDLVDYREFIISGKVLLVQKISTNHHSLPISGWLQRQRMFANDASTYTWKNHLQWYQKRKAKAVIYLIRSAKLAFKQSERLEKTFEGLKIIGKRALAVSYLMEVGRCALRSEDTRIEAKRFLLLRVLHSKRFRVVREEALVYLKYCGRLALDEEALANNFNASGTKKNIIVRHDRHKPAANIDFSRVYIQYYQKQQAVQYLRIRGNAAKALYEKKLNTLRSLIQLGVKIVNHLQIQDDIQGVLVAQAERYRSFLTVKDTCHMNLIRRGTLALKLLIKHEDTLASLMNHGSRAKEHVERQYNTYLSIRNQAQHQLWFLNRRENALAFLRDRGHKALTLQERKKESIAYLIKIPAKVWKNEKRIEKAAAWLHVRGDRAKEHTLQQYKALRQLQYYGGRAANIKRKLDVTFLELQQLSQHAKYKTFETKLMQLTEFQRRVNEERVRILRADSKKMKLDNAAIAESAASNNNNNNNNVNNTSYKVVNEDKLRPVLQDLFYWSSIMYNKISADEAQEILHANDVSTSNTGKDKNAATQSVKRNGFHNGITIGRFAFKRILQNGQLLQLLPESLDSYFELIDIQTKGLITFQDFFSWFVHTAKLLQKKTRKQLLFTVDEVIPAQERAIIAILRRAAENDFRQFLEENEDNEDNEKFFRRRDSDDEDSDSDDSASGILTGDDFGDDEFGILMAKMRIKPPPKQDIK